MWKKLRFPVCMSKFRFLEDEFEGGRECLVSVGVCLMKMENELPVFVLGEEFKKGCKFFFFFNPWIHTHIYIYIYYFSSWINLFGQLLNMLIKPSFQLVNVRLVIWPSQIKYFVVHSQFGTPKLVRKVWNRQLFLSVR